MNARLAGLLYLVVAVCGGFAELFARSTVRRPTTSPTRSATAPGS